MNWISRQTPLRAISKDGSSTVTDEFYNTWIAMLGLVLAIVGCIYLLKTSADADKPWHLLGYSIYTFGAVTLLLMSVLHHGIDGTEREEDFLRRMDYYAIFVMIAATQTPFCLILVRNAMGWTLLGIEWGLCILGIVLKAGFPRVPKKITTGIYLLMGWLGVFTVYPLYTALGPPSVVLLALGGILYTVGSAIFMWERPNPWPGKFGFHEIWHAMVVTAALCHYIVMVQMLSLQDFLR